MSGFNFRNIHREFPDQILQKSLIWIWNADKIPPHIGISVGKDYFSLTYRKSEQLQTSSMIKKVRRSLIPLVWVEIPGELVREDPQSVFSTYQRAVDGITCLKPIKEVFQITEQAEQLSDLLAYLDSAGMIRGVHGVNLPETYTAIPDYSLEDIWMRIRALNAKN